MKPVRFSAVLLLWLLALPLPVHADADYAVVLMYHRFDEGRYPSTSIRLTQFQAQLDYLERENYQVWPLSRLVDALFSGQPVPPRTVVISIDDAYRSVYTVAFPLLKARGWPMTVFVSTGAVNAGRADVMSWEQMREMQQHGVEFANHTVNHPHLPRRLSNETKRDWEARIRTEITQAQQDLQQHLGITPPMLLAYPYGEYDASVARIARELGYIAFGQHSGAIGRHSDRRSLPRYAMAEPYADMDRFVLRIRSLPMPLAKTHPWEPLIGETNPPVLSMWFTQADIAGTVSCFLGDGTALEVLKRDSRQLTVRATRPLGSGRSRYNCTAPARDGRFYWFSQPWLNLN